MKSLAIVGGGSWGTALSVVLAPRFESLRLWVYEEDLASRLESSRENDIYLPGIRVPDNVRIASDLTATVQGADIVLGVMPSHHARGLYERIRPLLSHESLVVSATKGLETGTLLRMSEVIEQGLGPRKVAVLSGPTFAREVARGEPTALVVASRDAGAASTVQAAFSGRSFRLYTNSDPVGVELGASLKNVIAIGAGICQGLGLGSNTLAALITRGLAEITRLAVALGGQPRTLAGLAGLGDLVLTCHGELSRNRRVGIELAKGRRIQDIVAEMKMVAEGVETTSAAVELALRHGIEMPIVTQMDSVIRLGRSPKDAIRDLMERTLKEE